MKKHFENGSRKGYVEIQQKTKKKKVHNPMTHEDSVKSIVYWNVFAYVNGRKIASEMNIESTERLEAVSLSFEAKLQTALSEIEDTPTVSFWSELTGRGYK